LSATMVQKLTRSYTQITQNEQIWPRKAALEFDVQNLWQNFYRHVKFSRMLQI
jgi:hypothetical protein